MVDIILIDYESVTHKTGNGMSRLVNLVHTSVSSTGIIKAIKTRLLTFIMSTLFLTYHNVCKLTRFVFHWYALVFVVCMWTHVEETWIGGYWDCACKSYLNLEGEDMADEWGRVDDESVWYDILSDSFSLYISMTSDTDVWYRSWREVGR
ncbi:hypothetical protein Tco_0538685 [Tanacetum coccineum]